MNTNLVTSYIVGGLVLISIIAMNLNLMQSSNKLTMRQMTQQYSDGTTALFKHDLVKMGYQSTQSTPNPILKATETHLVFEGDLDKNGTLDTVEWFFDQQSPVSSTENPNDYKLARKIDGVRSDINLGITQLRFTYLDASRDTLITPVIDQDDRNKIKYINVELRFSSKVRPKAGDSGQDYIHTTWNKTFSPVNLN